MSLKISIEGLKSVQKNLDTMEKRVPYALQKGASKAATKMKRDVHSELKKVYTIQNAKLKKSKLNVRPASLSSPIAVLRFSGRANPVTHFKTVPKNRSSNKAGKPAAAAQIKHENNLKEFKIKQGDKTLKAFIANFGGNKLMVSRTGGKTENGKDELRTFYSASYPAMIENEKVYDKVAPAVHDLLEQHVMSQLGRYLNYSTSEFGGFGK